ASTTVESRPSEKFGTHSINGSGIGLSIRASMPPSVANLELHARVHAGIAVAERGTGNMNRVGGKVNGPPRIYEIVKTNSTLRREVKHARPPGFAMRNQNVRRKFMRRVDQPAGALKPRREVPRRGKIPSQNNWSNAEARVRSAAVRFQHVASLALIIIFDLGEMRSGRGGLPIGHQFARVLKLAAQESRQIWLRNHLAQTHPGGRKSEVAAVAHADSALEKCPELPRKSRQRGFRRSVDW